MTRISRKPLLLPLVVGVILVVLVLSPMLQGGWLWLLDSVTGPHRKFPRQFFGLDGGVFEPLALALYLLDHVIGERLTGLLPFLVTFPVAAIGMWRLLPGGKVARLGGALFYCLTPVIYDRLWVGHSGYLVGYALLPFIVSSYRFARDGERLAWVRVAGWVALATAASPHFIWISIVLLGSLLLVQRPTRQILAGAALAVMLAGLCSAYLLPSSKDAARQFTVDQRDISAFSAHAIGNEPLGFTVATMRGFWRMDRLLPINDFPGRELLLLIGVLVIVLGLFRGAKNMRLIARGLVLGSMLATFLAMGNHGPTSGIFLWLFDHVPGFAIMREPLKFVAINALGSAFLFGLGLERLSQAGQNEANTGRRAMAIPAIIALVVPLAISPGIFWGYGNRLHGVSYPQAWDAADEQMKGGAVLALPWHQYLTYPFLHERIVANPSSAVFSNEVYEGDNVELPGLPTASSSTASAYFSYLFASGKDITAFGALVAPLNVHYVVRQKTVDWQQYAWIDAQTDLRKVSDNKDITVYENTKWFGSAYGVKTPVTVADWGELVGYANATGDVRGVFTKSNVAGVIRAPSEAATPVFADAQVKKNNPISYRVGADSTTVLSERFVPGWTSKHANVSESPQGGITITNSGAPTTLHYSTWSRYVLAYAISIFAIAVVATLSVLSKRRRYEVGK